MKIAIFIVLSILVVVYVVGQFSEKEILTEIEINASADDVWNILVSFDDYSSWNPFITKVSGEPITGTTINITIEPEGEDGMNFEPEILVAMPGRELRWLGTVLVPGIFDGEHYFTIEQISESKVRLMQGEYFSGVLVLPLWSGMEASTKQGFEDMNKALKKRAESINTPTQQP